MSYFFFLFSFRFFFLTEEVRVIEDIEYGEGETGEGGIEREKGKGKGGKELKYEGEKGAEETLQSPSCRSECSSRGKKGILDFGIMLQKPFEG